MDENEDSNLDVEFKRYLQIMRPYLAQLLDQDVIEICKAWIQRLSNCNANEKLLRNKYVFALCYQLAKGVLDEPFLKYPEPKKLDPISEELDNEASTSEVDYIVIDCEDDTKVLYNNSKIPISDTDYLSLETDCDECKDFTKDVESHNQYNTNVEKQAMFCYNCPEVKEYNFKQNSQCGEYKYRANNLVLKLRDIKTQNMLLHKELELLKEECKMRNTEDRIIKVDHCTSACSHATDNSITVQYLKNQLQEIKNSKKILIQTINNLQEKLHRYDDDRRREMEEIEANNKMEIIKIKSLGHEETKDMYERKLNEIKEHYEEMINKIQCKSIEEKQDLSLLKDNMIAEKEKIVISKDEEIARLKTQIEDQKNHLHDVINKFIEKPNEELNTENMKRTEELEKRLNKVEKSKTKCARVYETKLAHLQREKHLAECSFQLQLVKQRTQIVNEVTDENQAELSTALNKLESKYKEIVAAMQATAIQRRMQDQAALESILYAACGITSHTNSSHGNGQYSKPMQNQNRNSQMNQSFDSEMSTLIRGSKVDNGNKSLAECSLMAGYCLDGERMGELFERVYIPQRDIGDGSLKKQ
jgi:hypothetical protein